MYKYYGIMGGEGRTMSFCNHTCDNRTIVVQLQSHFAVHIYSHEYCSYLYCFQSSLKSKSIVLFGQAPVSVSELAVSAPGYSDGYT